MRTDDKTLIDAMPDLLDALVRARSYLIAEYGSYRFKVFLFIDDAIKKATS